jgi:site-specific DNA recombinase
MGLVAEMSRKSTAANVRLGHRDRVHEGRSVDPKWYGYVTTTTVALAINESGANIVRRIFSEYANGVSTTGIFDRLNDENIAAPRSAWWNPALLNGSPKRGSGILNGALYRGVMKRGKSADIASATTGVALARPTDASTHISVDAPRGEMALRIDPEGALQGLTPPAQDKGGRVWTLR